MIEDNNVNTIQVANNLEVAEGGFSGFMLSLTENNTEGIFGEKIEQNQLDLFQKDLKEDLVYAYNQGLDIAVEVLSKFYINDDSKEAEENNDFIDMLILEVGAYYSD